MLGSESRLGDITDITCHDIEHHFMHLYYIPDLSCTEDTLAERLSRRPAKPMGSPRVGSNPTGVEL